MGYQLINVVHDCFEFALDNGLKETEEARAEVNSLLKRREEVLNKIKDFDETKNNYMRFTNFEFQEIEQAITVTYAQLKAWENEISLVNRSFNKVKRIAERKTKKPNPYQSIPTDD